MNPYKTRLEYSLDIKRLMKLLLEAFKSADPAPVFAFREEMRARVGETALFIPLEHVMRAFSIAGAGEYLLFTVFAYESDAGFRQTLSSTSGISYITASALEALSAFFAGKTSESFSLYGFADNILRKDHNGDYALKDEITRFIFEPGRLIERQWLKFSYQYGAEGMPLFDSGVSDGLARLAEACLLDKKQRRRVIAVTGKAGGGRRSLIRHIADENKLSVLFVDCGQIANAGNILLTADEIKTESTLTSSLVCFCDIDKLADDAETLNTLLWGAAPAIGTAFATTETGGLQLPRGYEVIEYALPAPSAEITAMLWESAAHETDIGVDLGEISQIFSLTPHQIKQSAAIAHSAAIARGAEKITQADIAAACRDVSARNIGKLGKIISPSFKWGDLILPPEQKDALRNAIERVRRRKTVFDEWRFSEKMPYGAGAHILLHGPPGTGKTMAARVIAGELGLYVYQIDMALVVSKYIGETEKNLDAIFKEGESSNSILFFDEADSLFGKRTEIKDAHDRHANLQVSFLLQKIEEYQGVVILATNLIKNFDEAFKRRFQFIIGFPLPDKEHREKIWESAFPPEAPLAEDVDFELLSDLIMSGSGIKNAALSAAFYAAGGGGSIGMREILKAIKDEMAKSGGSFASELFDDYGGA